MFKPEEIRIEKGVPYVPNPVVRRYWEYTEKFKSMEIGDSFSVELNEANRKHVVRIIYAANQTIKDRKFTYLIIFKDNQIRCFCLDLNTKTPGRKSKNEKP